MSLFAAYPLLKPVNSRPAGFAVSLSQCNRYLEPGGGGGGEGGGGVEWVLEVVVVGDGWRTVDVLCSAGVETALAAHTLSRRPLTRPLTPKAR